MVNQDLVTQRPHLKSWFDLVDRSHQGKKSLVPFERMFLVHHFWRVFFSRYRVELNNRVTSLHTIFSAFLRRTYAVPGGTDRVRKDLTAISKGRSDPYWYLKDTPFEQV